MLTHHHDNGAAQKAFLTFACIMSMLGLFLLA